MTVRAAVLGFGLLFVATVVPGLSPGPNPGPIATAAAAPPAPSADGPRRIVLAERTDYFGNDYETLREVSLADCQAACIADARCRAFTFNTRVGWCFLKTDYAEPRAFADATSGHIETGPSASPAAQDPALARTAARRAELAMVPTQYRDEAAALRQRLAAPGATAADGDLDEAIRRALAAVQQAPDDSGRWLTLANAALASKPDDWGAQQQVRKLATAAAINAYLTADAIRERAAALAALGRGLERRYAWRPAIRVHRAALALVDDPKLTERLAKLVAEHGFRVLDHQVAADARDPRVCVRFSDPLARDGTNLADFVSVDRDGLAIEPEASQICIDGVRHGEKVRITVRAGLPASDGERLARAVELDVYVRDRGPSVRFPGRAYVLPRGGATTLPVVSVNTQRIDATLYRVADRAVGGFVADGNLLAPLADYDAEALAERRGEQLWTGSIEVRAALNEEVTTAVPVSAMLAETSATGLDPGAYVLTARPHEGPADAPLATQWFVVSDLGLAALSGGDGLHALVRSLGSAAPVAGVRLRLMALNQQVLGEAVSDDQGYARFSPGLLRGTGGNAPALLVAEAEGDYGFLDLKGAAFDLSDRGVEGRPAPQPLDVYLTAERGIYRPGETVFLTALLRDARANAVLDVPLTFVVRRPDGVEYLREQVPDQGGGGRALAVPLLPIAMRGTWQVMVYADPKGDLLAQVPFLVEDFEPERLAFELNPGALRLDPQDLAPIDLTARFLYGAPAANLPVEGQVRVVAADGLPAWPGVRFGLADEQVEPRAEPLPATETDAEGRARVSLALPELAPTSRLLAAEIDVSVLDGGGRPVERSVTLPIADARPRLGIRPLFDGAVEEGGNAGFEVIAIAPDGTRLAPRGLRWTLSRVETGYQWYQTDGDWRFEPVVNRTRVASGTLDLAAGAAGADGAVDPAGGATGDDADDKGGTDAAGLPVGRIETGVDWGGYLLEVTAADPSDALLPVSLGFEAGWYVAPKAFDTPDVLKVSLDKAEYRVGETARVRLAPRFPGVALVMVIDDGLKTMRPVEVPAEGVTVDLPVTADWGPGAYVTAMLYRGMDIDAKRMPRRAIGLHWIAVDPGDRRLAVSLELPQTADPRAPLPVTVDVENLLAGAEAHVVIAAVDVGILNLTRFAPWAPDHWYFGQRRLGMALRDLYGRLIDRMQGEPGRLRSGAGALAISRLDGPPPTEALVAFHSGVLRADDEGKARVEFPLPDFNGTLRVMAMAWSVGGVGQANAEVLVRDPVVMAAALPRFLAPGDRSRLRVDLAHVEGPAGAMTVRATSLDAGLHIADGGPRTVEVPAGGRVPVSFGLVAEAVGDHRIEVELVTPDGKTLTKHLTLGVRDLEPPVRQTAAVRLAPGGAPLALDASIFQPAADDAAPAEGDPGADAVANLSQALATLPALVPGTAELLVSISGAGDIDVAGLLRALDRFPFGCVEQVTSRALPLLYLDQVALAAGLDPDAGPAGGGPVASGADGGPAGGAAGGADGDSAGAADGATLRTRRIADAITRIVAMQGANGSFGLWGPGGWASGADGSDLWLNAYVTDFLTRAKEQGHAVPAVAFGLALDNLKNQLGYASEFERGGEGVAYALYVLARNARIPLGDLRYFLETRLDAFSTPMARAQLGAALALYGEQARAARAFESALALWAASADDGLWRADFGSRLRDGAALLALAAESGTDALDLDALAADLGADGALATATSTQDQAWLLLAAHALMQGAAAPRLAIDGADPASGPLFRRLDAAALADGAALDIANAGQRPVTALVTAAGIPVEPPPAGGTGYRIERAWYDLDGRRVDPARVEQGARLVVLLTVEADTALAARLVVDDPLPAGLEIDNPHLLAGAALSALPWLGQGGANALVEQPLHVEFRAERFIAAVDRDADDPVQFQLAYLVRAVSPGQFAHPAATVEDLYRPIRRARTGSATMEVISAEAVPSAVDAGLNAGVAVGGNTADGRR